MKLAKGIEADILPLDPSISLSSPLSSADQKLKSTPGSPVYVRDSHGQQEVRDPLSGHIIRVREV